MLTLPYILEKLSTYDGHEQRNTRITLPLLARFFDICRRFYPLIAYKGPRAASNGYLLPDNIRETLATELKPALSLGDVDVLWDAFGDHVLMPDDQDNLFFLAGRTDHSLAASGPQFGLAALVMAPPFSTCQTVGCKQEGRPLGSNRSEHPGHLYTQDRGVLPIRVLSLYCIHCSTTYAPNYSVQYAKSANAMRRYYNGLPRYIEVQEQTYISSALIRTFRLQITFAHTSGETCARIYNLGQHADTVDLPPIEAPRLTGSTVWNSFFLHALLLDAQREGVSLEVPHGGHHASRLNDALDRRNRRMAGTGQPHWAHACDDCEKVRPPPPGQEHVGYTRINARVMDGVTVGHTRCNVSLCTQRLRSPRDRFCPEHGALANQCAIGGCKNPTRPGKRTCALLEHSTIEEERRARGQAYVLLRSRLRRSDNHRRATAGDASASSNQQTDQDTAARPAEDAAVTGEESALEPLDDAEFIAHQAVEDQLQAALDPPDDEVMESHLEEAAQGQEEDVQAQPATSEHQLSTPEPHTSALQSLPPSSNVPPSSDSTSKPSKRKTKPRPLPRSALTRRWTHNEQLMVGCCGVVLSRATMFEAESMSNALLFIRGTFPPRYPRALPSYLFFDNNCLLLRFLQSNNLTDLLDTCLPVDVFHAKSKHKESDVFCATNCNPAAFPELHTDDGDWIFNSSAAEQINVWFGAFAPIVREMGEIRYNFVLDEVLIEQNDFRVGVLARQGKNPRLIPLEELALPRTRSVV